MNVQTLPPGYKTAPWTPPEKIDGKGYKKEAVH